MIRTTLCIALVAGGLGAGCAKREPRAIAYFAAHLDEAQKLVAECRGGSASGQECANADAAVQEAAGKAKLKRFLGR